MSGETSVLSGLVFKRVGVVGVVTTGATKQVAKHITIVTGIRISIAVLPLHQEK